MNMRLMKNKKNMWVSVLILLCVLSPAIAEPIRFAPLPMLAQSELEKDFQPFAHYLSTITNTDVETVYSKSYQNLIAGLLNDTIDIAFLGPLPYVTLTQQDPTFEPLVRFVNREGNATYTCSLVSFDAAVSSFNSAMLPTIALTQTQSTCGPLVTDQLLQRFNTSLNDLPYYYTGNHSTCALDVLRDRAQFAGLKTSIALQYRNLGLKIVAQSDPLPGFLLVANTRTLDSDTIQHIKESLLHLKENEAINGTVMMAHWGEMIRYGAIDASSADYDVIRDMVDQMNATEGEL